MFLGFSSPSPPFFLREREGREGQRERGRVLSRFYCAALSPTQGSILWSWDNELSWSQESGKWAIQVPPVCNFFLLSAQVHGIHYPYYVVLRIWIEDLSKIRTFGRGKDQRMVTCLFHFHANKATPFWEEGF